MSPVPPKKIRHLETIWIPMSDGARLAGRLWLPEDAEQHPVPAILEYIPYRRRDGTREGDELTHPYFAGHGYACLRLDIRGSGDSEGVIHDEYPKQEQDDAVEAIAWLAAQPWCNGKVGMMGISWGGFNALQVAARRPPALKAIVTVCSTDDRYADDMHYMGGCHADRQSGMGLDHLLLSWAAPPDPLIVGDAGARCGWQRLEAVTPYYAASGCAISGATTIGSTARSARTIGAITCAVIAVGGWADGYTNAVFRLLRTI